MQYLFMINMIRILFIHYIESFQNNPLKKIFVVLVLGMGMCILNRCVVFLGMAL